MTTFYEKYDSVNCIFFRLNPIITTGKPGCLIDLNVKNISKELNINFYISKFFYINDLNSNDSRGNHSNTNAREILVCLNGSFEITLNNGTDKIYIKVTKNEGVFIDKNIWIEFYNFENCIILAFVDIDNSDNQKNSRYDFNEFMKKSKVH